MQSISPSPFPLPSIYLASNSPRQAQILDLLKVSYQIIKPQNTSRALAAEELEVPLPNEKADDYVLRVSRLKSIFFENEIRTALNLTLDDPLSMPILTADTTVTIDNEILGKPESPEQAFYMLNLLRNRTHDVHTAFCISHQQHVHHQLVTSSVEMADMSDQWIHQYIKSQEPFGKAGAYAIQGLGGSAIKSINGSYTAIMGLPLHEVFVALQKFSPT